MFEKLSESSAVVLQEKKKAVGKEFSLFVNFFFHFFFIQFMWF